MHSICELVSTMSVAGVSVSCAQHDGLKTLSEVNVIYKRTRLPCCTYNGSAVNDAVYSLHAFIHCMSQVVLQKYHFQFPRWPKKGKYKDKKAIKVSGCFMREEAYTVSSHVPLSVL